MLCNCCFLDTHRESLETSTSRSVERTVTPRLLEYMVKAPASLPILHSKDLPGDDYRLLNDATRTSNNRPSDVSNIHTLRGMFKKLGSLCCLF